MEDWDVYQIVGTNITNLMLNTMKKLCFSCDNITIESDLNVLECSCQMCKECLTKYLNQATNGEMLLNKFEKSKYYFLKILRAFKSNRMLL